MSADAVAEGLRGLGLELDKEQVNAIRRLGAPQAMKSLVELGSYFQGTKNKKCDKNAYGVSKSLPNVAASTSQGHSSTGAADSMLIKDEQCEASSPGSSSQVRIVNNYPRTDLDSIAGFIDYNSPDHHGRERWYRPLNKYQASHLQPPFPSLPLVNHQPRAFRCRSTPSCVV